MILLLWHTPAQKLPALAGHLSQYCTNRETISVQFRLLGLPKKNNVGCKVGFTLTLRKATNARHDKSCFRFVIFPAYHFGCEKSAAVFTIVGIKIAVNCAAVANGTYTVLHKFHAILLFESWQKHGGHEKHAQGMYT